MPEDLQRLLDTALKKEFTDEQQEIQRRSFAYGNTHFENESISRDTVDRAAEALKAGDAKD